MDKCGFKIKKSGSLKIIVGVIMKDLKKELFRLRLEFDVIQQVYCSKDEEKQIKQLIKNKHKHPLPNDIHTNTDGTHFRFVNSDMSREDMDELLLYKQLKYLKTIKNSMIFFVVLVIIPLICTFLFLI